MAAIFFGCQYAKWDAVMKRYFPGCYPSRNDYKLYIKSQVCDEDLSYKCPCDHKKYSVIIDVFVSKLQDCLDNIMTSWHRNAIRITGTLCDVAYGVGSAAHHYSDVIMHTMASQITSLAIVCSNVYSGADKRKHQSSASQAFVREIHRGPVNSPHKRPVTRKMFSFDDVIMLIMHLIR